MKMALENPNSYETQKIREATRKHPDVPRIE